MYMLSPEPSLENAICPKMNTMSMENNTVTIHLRKETLLFVIHLLHNASNITYSLKIFKPYFYSKHSTKSKLKCNSKNYTRHSNFTSASQVLYYSLLTYFMSINSTLLFLALPSSVSFGAIGLSKEYPSVVILSLASPFLTSSFFTDSALALESLKL